MIYSFNLAILEHHLIKKNQISALEKLHSKNLYIMQIVEGYKKPTSQIYFENVFQKYDFQWNIIYLLPRLVTIDSVMRAFQYKILHNVLFLNKQLFFFNKVTSPLSSICNKEDETPTHLFFTCSFTTSLWKQLQNALLNILVLPNLTPQSAIFGFLNIEKEYYLVINHLLLIFKLYIYKDRNCKRLNLQSLKRKIVKICNIEKDIAQKNTNKQKKFDEKWKAFEQIVFLKKKKNDIIPKHMQLFFSQLIHCGWEGGS